MILYNIMYYWSYRSAVAMVTASSPAYVKCVLNNVPCVIYIYIYNKTDEMGHEDVLKVSFRAEDGSHGFDGMFWDAVDSDHENPLWGQSTAHRQRVHVLRQHRLMGKPARDTSNSFSLKQQKIDESFQINSHLFLQCF